MPMLEARSKRALEGKQIPIEPQIPQRFLNRELSQLAFNERVLALAQRTNMPLGERLRFVCIVSAKSGRIFEIRVSDLMDTLRESGDSARTSPQRQELLQIAQRTHALVDRQYALYNETIMPALAAVEDRRAQPPAAHSDAQRAWVRDYFCREVMPLLVADRTRSLPPLPAGDEQGAELYRPARGPGRLRPRLRRSPSSRCRAPCPG